MILLWQGHAKKIPEALSRADLHHRHSRIRVRQQDYSAKVSDWALSRSSENTEKLPTILENNVTCSWWWEECYCSESMRTFRCSQCVEQARKRHGCLSVASWLSVATMPPSEARPISGEQVLLGMHNTLLSKCRVAPFPFPTNWPIKAFLNLGKKSCKRNLYFTTVSFPQASQRLKRKRQYKAGQRLFTWKHTAWK